MDNESKAESATNVALKLIDQENVVAIIGPNSSKQAVPAGGTCNDNRVPMISPWSTNPNTTLDRPWIFRAAFLDPFQGPVVADFAAKKFDAKTAAVLFDVSNDYSKGLAEIFKSSWEAKGLGPVVAFESHGTKDQDFSAQLTTIVKANPDFIFVPDNYNQVALIIQQARDLGYKGPFMGSDAWGTPDLIKLCGDECYGNFFSTHYAAAGAKGATKIFIDRYEKNTEPLRLTTQPSPGTPSASWLKPSRTLARSYPTPWKCVSSSVKVCPPSSPLTASPVRPSSTHRVTRSNALLSSRSATRANSSSKNLSARRLQV